MPKNVRFTQDYRGVLTGERFFLEGETVALSDEMAERVIQAGRATAAPGRPPAESDVREAEPSIIDAAIEASKAEAPKPKVRRTRKPKA